MLKENYGKKIFSLDVSDVTVEPIENSDFLMLKMYAICDGVNRNNSNFLRDSFEKGIPSIYNKPILAYFNKDINDVEEHNSNLDLDEFGELFSDYQYETAEKPVGVIPESAEITIERKDNKNWIVISKCIIWDEYNHQLVSLIKKQLKKKVSVEVIVLDSYIDSMGVENITSWKFLGVTILGKFPNGEEVQEGIEGAHLRLLDLPNSEMFSTYTKRLEFALKDDKITFLSKDKWGTGEDISLDKSKKSVSTQSWGSVDKTKLRNDILKAKNYKSLVKSAYLLVMSDWEENPSNGLKYPVMQIKDNKLVYNSNGLLSAQQYGEKYDESVASKAKKIRKKLGLLPDKEENMKSFIESAKEKGLVCLGLYNGKLRFAKVCEEKDIEEDKEEMSVFEIEKEECSKEEEFSEDKLEEKCAKFEEDEEDSEEKHKESKVYKDLEKEKSKLEKKYSDVEKELKTLKDEKFKEETDKILESEDIDQKSKDELSKMRDEDKFADVEEFVKELAFRKYIKSKKTSSKLDFSIDKNKKKENKSDSALDVLSRI